MEHVVFKHRRTTLERAEKFLSSLYFTDVNLYGRLYSEHVPVTNIEHYAATGRVSYDEAVKGDYSPTAIGQSFGPTWSTHWFRIHVEIPSTWEDREVRLLWNCGAEAQVWIDGHPVQGLSGEHNPRRDDFIVSKKLTKQQIKQTFYIEMACNGLFGAGKHGLVSPTDPNRAYTLSKAEVAIFDREVADLFWDLQVLYEMAKDLPENSERGYQTLYALNNIINQLEVGNRTTYTYGRELAKQFLSQKNSDSQHVLHAMGHAHIDTAWLWPYAETIRKCARSWSTTVQLMERYPHFLFTCSQAQQFEWVKQYYPSLYSKICHFVKEGRFIPVGGSWVEMDGNIPSGEAFIRQFLYGQEYFRKEFGVTCTEFWLPDTFGYAAQIPQMMQHCGMTRFLTQKLSWNLVNKFPHSTFWWSGLDGSTVLTHFPPGDNYAMEGKVQEVLYSVKNFKDKGRSGRSCYLFGYGDGGHGPSEDMLEKLQRLENVDGIPKVKMSSPDEFFSLVEKESRGSLCTWHGELYLEMHNGTYTTQAKVKKENRYGEILLRNTELFATIATVGSLTSDSGYKYPQAELQRLWKLLLLNQFHDVLPGSSIEIVYEDAHRYYEDIRQSGATLFACAVANVLAKESEPSTPVVVNSLCWERSEVVIIQRAGDEKTSEQKKPDDRVQTDSRGNTLAFVKAPSCGVVSLVPLVVPGSVEASVNQNGLITLKNDHLTVTVDHCGRVTSLQLAGSEKNTVSCTHPANQFLLYDDVPLYWDAWDVMDYHLETRKPINSVIGKATILDKGPLKASVEFSLTISKQSHLKQLIVLEAGCSYVKFVTQVTWHENRKFLKVEFPTSIHCESATYDIQFGHIKRPTHYNTSWDSARFEVCSHKWADLSEYDFGLSVLNDCKYGFSTVNNVMRLSLLRSPKAPDEHADMGSHEFTYALMPHKGSLQDAGVIQQAYNLNSPLVVQYVPQVPSTTAGFFSLSTPQVVLEAVKMAERVERAMILRLYEAFGGKTSVTLTLNLPVKNVKRCTGLEDVLADDDDSLLFTPGQPATVCLTLRPFQIVSLIAWF
ncbi:alpha-mannosidase 2C1-like [Gigantopelta aegis]|uniref:alpha-mannosidase 2C1-like n=1 Tax=Gigantopelta aegis TaxID=1735272 RepID=UPI001B88E331|nr:alpha-mannosidase 2C1-like [Gigantopelta aegis]